MARFSVGGDEDENEERPTNSRPLPKKPRTSNFIYERNRKPDAAAPSTSNASGGATVSTPGNPSAPLSPTMPDFPLEDSDGMEEESEAGSFEASDRSSSDSFSEEVEGESEEGEEEEQQNQRSGDDVRSAEARVDSTPNGNGSCLESGVPGGPIPLTLTDTDVLDCPICFDPLCSPVYQVPSFS